MRIVVTVPASTSNLGPGFDCLGLALDLTNSFMFETRNSGSGWKVKVNGPGAAKLPANDRNLVVRAAKYAFALQGFKPEGEIAVNIEANVPLWSGLGSSASAVVAGMSAANAIMGNPLPDDAIFEQMVLSEGHPDNVSPAYLGGLTVSFFRVGVDGELPIFYYRRHEPHKNLRLVVLHPHYEVQTSKARSILPEMIDRRGAALNLARVPFLVDALAEGQFDRLHNVMIDHLHEPFRRGTIRHFDDIVMAGEQAGAHAVVLSGSGPSMAAFCDAADSVENAVAAAMKNVVESNGITADTYILRPHEGMKIQVID